MKFMLLQHYAPTETTSAPISEWDPADIQAHIQFQVDMNRELQERGELVEANALTGPELAKIVVSDGKAAPVVTDGPYLEAKEFLAGYRMIDVESLDRALEIAAKASAAPGPGGVPIKSAIEVREVMGAPGGDI
jgi:hypothetical protein